MSMAKRHEAGCMWGIISIFGRSTRLLSDTESEKATVKTSVKELMEEEMVSEQTDGDELDKTSSQNHQDSSSQYSDLEALMKEFLLNYHKDSFSVVEDKLSAAVEVFLDEMSSDERSFQMLTSNKQLFLKLLQDQADQKSNSKPIARKHRNFFRRRSKSQENMPISRIVILKPNSPDNRFKIERDFHSERLFSSHFSFMDIKKRLKNAMGKEQLKRVVEGSSGWSSPNRDHFYTERFNKKVERVSKLKESETANEDDIYIEAKKHLSEMLTAADGDADLFMENLPKTLGKIISFPEYNSLSPPRKQNEDEFVMRLFPPADFHLVNQSQPCAEELKVNDEDIPGGTGVVEITEAENQQQMENYICDGDIVQVSDEESSPKSDLAEENEFSSQCNKAEEPESGRPSPVSVLDPLFSDTEISPAKTISRRPVESVMQPLCIRFEDEDICRRNCNENEESAFDYIEAVLLASDLNWDEFEKRWLSSLQILDSSLFDEVEIFSSRSSYDQRLLFDSINDILKEICDCYLDFDLQLSYIERKIQWVPKGGNLINQVWERIELNSKNNYPLSLDHLVKKDLGTSRTWMDLRSDSKEVVFEIDESIFEDIMDDTILSLVTVWVDNET